MNHATLAQANKLNKIIIELTKAQESLLKIKDPEDLHYFLMNYHWAYIPQEIVNKFITDANSALLKQLNERKQQFERL